MGNNQEHLVEGVGTAGSEGGDHSPSHQKHSVDFVLHVLQI